MAPKTPQFLKRFAMILDNPAIRSFQWTEDGKSVIVNSKLYEEEKKEHKDLTLMKKLKDIAALRGFLCMHGFKRTARRSRADIHVFQHPDFLIKGAAKVRDAGRKRSKCSSLSIQLPQHEGAHVKTAEEGMARDNTPPSMSTDVPSDLHFLPVKRRNARALYQYINYIPPQPEIQSPQDSGTAFSSPEEQHSTEHAPEHPTPSAPEPSAAPTADLAAGSSREERTDPPVEDPSLKDRILSLCRSTNLLPPLSPPHPATQTA